MQKPVRRPRDNIAIGRFALHRDIRVFDFTAFSRSAEDPEIFEHTRYDFVSEMEEEISKPILPYEKQREYIATQIVAEYLRAVWPFASGCILVVAAGSAGYLNFMYSTWLLPSYEGIHNFTNPTTNKWPDPAAKRDTETIEQFRKRMILRLNWSHHIAVGACAGSITCLLVGVWQAIANLA